MADSSRKPNGQFAKGVSSWMKGRHPIGPNKGKKFSAEWKAKLSAAKKGRPPAYMSGPNREEIFSKISASNSGEKAWNWKGGVTKRERDLFTRRREYKIFRLAVLERDGKMCVECKATDKLQVDHILPFSTHPELRMAMDNCRTLCVPCHIKTPTYGGRQSYINFKQNG